MRNLFITKIYIAKVRNIENFDISLNREKKMHLMLTGKNGSGKTSMLQSIKKFLLHLENNTLVSMDVYKDTINHYLREKKRIEDLKQRTPIETKTIHDANSIVVDRQLNQARESLINEFSGIDIGFNVNNLEVLQDIYEKEDLTIKLFDANRKIKFDIPTGPHALNINRYNISIDANKHFLQYLVNLKADKSFARDDDDIETVQRIAKWFIRFEDSLKNIFEENVKLIFERKKYNFTLKFENNNELDFNILSDGYSAFLNIVTELLIRMQTKDILTYDLQGFVLIDEIETHLHVELQKKILPFLISLFPNIQFIVSTHSPFVLTSISNAIICDLEKKIVTDDLSSYSYDAIIESYFGVDKYSDKLKSVLKEYESLSNLKELTDEQEIKIKEIENYLENSPKYFAPELQAKLQEIKLKNITLPR